MNMHKRSFLSILLVSFFIIFSTSIRAEEVVESYKDKIETKALSGLANIGTGWLEIPKIAINVSNDSNIIWGLTAGLAKGIIIAGGRTASGAADLLTFPIATKPITHPVYIWDDLDAETRFGDGMRLKDRPRRDAFMP